MKNLIVCAANKYIVKKPNGETEKIVIPDSGHFCKNMQQIIKLLKSVGCVLEVDKDDEDRGQGFIDESSNYHNRKEAYKIVLESGQPFNKEYLLPNEKLDSSCIRHFEDDS